MCKVSLATSDFKANKVPMLLAEHKVSLAQTVIRGREVGWEPMVRKAHKAILDRKVQTGC